MPEENTPNQPIEPNKAAEVSKPAEANKPAAPVKPAEAAVAPVAPPIEGPYGKLLKEKGITSTPMPESTGIETLELQGNDLPTAMRILREKAKLNFLVAVSGVDSADTFDSVYHLWSFSTPDELVVKVRVPKANVPADKLPEVPSLASYWETADWHERETYDLVGIRYIGHRYLRRILNPWDWEGHPLRRDYKQPVDALNDKHPVSMR